MRRTVFAGNKFGTRGLAIAIFLLCMALASTLAHRVQAQQPAAAPAPPPGPVHVITFVDITPNNREAGTDLCKQYIVDTRKDAGVTRAELLVQSNRNNHMVLEVVFQNQAAYDRHVQAQHTKDFHAKLIPIIGSPFDERAHYVLQ